MSKKIFFNFHLVEAIGRQLQILEKKMEKHRNNPIKRINYILSALDAYGADTTNLPKSVKKIVNHEMTMLKKEGFGFVRHEGQIYIGKGDKWYHTYYHEGVENEWPKCLDSITDKCLYGKKEEW